MVEKKATILVVDDDQHIRDLIQRVLESADYRVITASSGGEISGKLSSEEIDLVLLDIKMPGMHGFQALELIREKSDIPVIMVTAMDEATTLQHSFNLGADDYVKKPFRTNELLARIHAKLRRSKE
ncbi:MAG: response regulator transcription factor [Dehalococcoidales bacterium]|nr:response regulator transcription factor [Dehalococcoidales bacterium]